MISSITKNFKVEDGEESQLKALETDKDRKALYIFVAQMNSNTSTGIAHTEQDITYTLIGVP
eukprot:4622624-Ditylum_brightwellii.AAC.1